jgi:hypothetical protein
VGIDAGLDAWTEGETWPGAGTRAAGNGAGALDADADESKGALSGALATVGDGVNEEAGL